MNHTIDIGAGRLKSRSQHLQGGPSVVTVAKDPLWPRTWLPQYAEATLAAGVAGDVWECGVFVGDLSVDLWPIAKRYGRALHLFDTFCGRPSKTIFDEGELSSNGLFKDTSAAHVQARVPLAHLHVGRLPLTFRHLDVSRIAFAYIDLDLYQSTYDALWFVWPRVSPGGLVAVHDYGSRAWPGVKPAVDRLIDERWLDDSVRTMDPTDPTLMLLQKELTS